MRHQTYQGLECLLVIRRECYFRNVALNPIKFLYPHKPTECSQENLTIGA